MTCFGRAERSLWTRDSSLWTRRRLALDARTAHFGRGTARFGRAEAHFGRAGIFFGRGTDFFGRAAASLGRAPSYSPPFPITRFKKKRSEEFKLFKPFTNYFPNLTAAMMSMIQPTMKATPPIGVMAPKMPMPERLRT